MNEQRFLLFSMGIMMTSNKFIILLMKILAWALIIEWGISFFDEIDVNDNLAISFVLLCLADVYERVMPDGD